MHRIGFHSNIGVKAYTPEVICEKLVWMRINGSKQGKGELRKASGNLKDILEEIGNERHSG